MPSRLLSQAIWDKVRADNFVESQVSKIIDCLEFPKNLIENEKLFWENFGEVVKGFLGNHKTVDYEELDETPVKTYSQMGWSMSLKVHILDSHLDRFKKNIVREHTKKSERSASLHQDILNFEYKFLRANNENMMGKLYLGLQGKIIIYIILPNLLKVLNFIISSFPTILNWILYKVNHNILLAQN